MRHRSIFRETVPYTEKQSVGVKLNSVRGRPSQSVSVLGLYLPQKVPFDVFGSLVDWEC